MTRSNKKRLRHHSKRLGVKTYISFCKLKDLLIELHNYYKLKGYPDRLLSPRANMNEYGYSCCAACNNSMHKRDSKKKSPKLAIADGFVIDKFPKLTYTNDNGTECEFNVDSDLTGVMRAMLAPT